MKSLQSKIYELNESRLNEGGFYKNVSGMVRPSTRGELKVEIRTRLDRGQYNLNDIDTSKITDMSYLFAMFDAYNLSKIDISKWDTSNVTNMDSMFYCCKFFNSDISKWDVSKVTNMNSMFEGCSKFNCDLSKWDVRNVRDMKYLFQGCSNFSADLSNWKVNGQVELFNTFNRSSAEEPRWYQKISRNREREAFKSIISGRIHF